MNLSSFWGPPQTRSGEVVAQLLNRRVVAVLGNLEQFIPVLQLEAHRASPLNPHHS